ncbi:hypothetical protein ACSBR1_015753 [Camellia fascicularis]
MGWYATAGSRSISLVRSQPLQTRLLSTPVAFSYICSVLPCLQTGRIWYDYTF